MTSIETESVQRIRESALAEIRKTGILGMRLVDVAAGADVSVPLIYKYFTDRDGLLAVVLGDVIERHIKEEHSFVTESIKGMSESTGLDEVLLMMPRPNDEWRRERRWLRLEAKAAAREIPALAERIGQALSNVERTTTDLIEKARKKSGNTSPVPARTVAWMVFSLSDGFSNNDLVEQPMTDDDYLPLIRALLAEHVF